MPMRRRRLLLGTVGALAAAAGLGGSAAFRSLAAGRGLATRTRAGLALGTTVALTLAGRDEADLEAALREGFRAIRAVEAAASLFRTDSALARLNRDGILRAPDPLLVTQLRFALDLAAASGGAFDPTVQPLWTLWAGHAARGGRPADAALRETTASVDWRRVRLEPDAIRLEPGMGLTLNGLVQGFAADRVMAVLEAHGIADAFVDTGEFGARGQHPDGTPWRLGLADPRAPHAIAEVLTPFSGFASTSGDYATSFSPDHADHHIFDPATGRSPAALSSVTVTAPTGLLADGLSTAAMVLGPAAGQRLVSDYPGCAARFTRKS
ncbi:FAD:protein FMN transferase [Methylobacterium planeticum]|uniref:FAD:protein FMN transferase n=1 Tax=Methylobacterium planeticum TaxID=2615211 RepID=A0A6N6MUU6_9HYPH|nr:FAD:protein FMN transferase [Methylobacterium planeticum]KAB1075530.1 FAD:protein FMN transferase [Methylobacterium planeticum]